MFCIDVTGEGVVCARQNCSRVGAALLQGPSFQRQDSQVQWYSYTTGWGGDLEHTQPGLAAYTHIDTQHYPLIFT